MCINHFPYQIFKVVNELSKDESDKSEQRGMLQGTSTAYPEVQEMVVRSEGYGGLPHYNNATWPIWDVRLHSIFFRSHAPKDLNPTCRCGGDNEAQDDD